MRILNRTALVVRPKRRFVEWANSLEHDGPKMTLEEARTNASLYLVREDDVDEASDIVDEYALEVFEEELWGWCADEDQWPKNRTAHVFRDWFDVEHIDLVGDLEETPLDDNDIDLDDALSAVLNHCAWCDRSLGEEDERFSLGLTCPDPDVLQDLEGPLLPVPLLGREQPLLAIVASPDSEARARGEHLLFTLCSDTCARELKTAFERDRSARRS